MNVEEVDLSKWKISEAPPTVIYIPNFISSEGEAYILDKVYSAPKPKWTQLSHRRLQNWGGIPHPSGMLAEKIPDWLMKYVDKVNKLNLFDEGKLKANHVLVNEYLPGQGIMPHTDGPLFYPTVTTITCGSHTVLEFSQPLTGNQDNVNRDKKIKFILERCSLVVVCGSMYENYLHSISEITQDELTEDIVNLPMTKYQEGKTIKRDTRISLTIRHVPKTTKVHIRLCK